VKIKDVLNWVVVSDLHCGCQLGLCPANGIRLDEGGMYKPNRIQRLVWGYWINFWKSWVPKVTKRKPYGVIVNGDVVDGSHHSSTHQITHNIADQAQIAYEILAPIVEKSKGLYMIRGTEAHVGQSGENEERLARRLGAIPNEDGQYARYELWKKIGGGLAHILHHIGTTGSQAYETTAVGKELIEEYAEAGRWRLDPPDIVVRSHRHRFARVEIPTSRGEGIAVVTPGWQAKTPYAWKLPGARLSTPQFGGILIRQGDEVLYVRSQVWTIGRSKSE